MWARSFVVCCFFATATFTSGRDQTSTNAELSVKALRSELAAFVDQPRFRGAQWGIKVVGVESGATLVDLDGEKLLKPASNAKLFTGALALDVLGGGYQIRTSLLISNRLENGVLAGDLVVYGRGDPAFSTVFQNERSTNVLAKLVQAIKDAGILEIQGDLAGESTFFRSAPFGSGWTWDDLQYYYGAEATALAVYDNVVEVAIRPGEGIGSPCRISLKPPTGFVEIVNQTTTAGPKTTASISIERPVGQNRAYVSGSLPKTYGTWNDSVSVSDAPLWFASLLKEELGRAGVLLKGGARAAAFPQKSSTGWREIGGISSPPVRMIVQKMMKMSQNLYAQLLLLQVGARSTSAERPNETTEELGIKALREFAGRAGIRGGEVLLDDGAGLSRSGLVTPGATVQLLKYMAQHKEAAAFRDSLPEAGTDGTLRNRLKDLKGRLRAKTGTIRFVNTLSGYVTSTAGEELAFSIMLNAYDAPPGSNSRDEVDSVIRLISRLSERGPSSSL